MKKLVAIFSFFLLSGAFCFTSEGAGQDSDIYYQKRYFLFHRPFPYDNLIKEVDYLCSPRFEGRKAGSEAMGALSEELAEGLERIGIESEIQEFELSDGGKGRNVLGRLEGSSGKWIVLAAYYDGLGTHDGQSYLGADANASSVAVLMELARKMAGERELKDGLLFVALDAHYDSYKGAQALLERLGRQNVKLFVNLEQMGNSLVPVDKRRPHYLIALGAEKYSKELKSSARLGRIEMYYEYYRSESFTNMFYRKIGEHTVFLKAGIPAIFFTAGITEHTNKSSDLPHTLDYLALYERTLCLERWLRGICLR
ncbi:MAG: M28 family peptidase [Candidatus Cryptobacteroides sp.]